MSLTPTLLRRVTLIGLLAGLLSGFAGPRGGIGGTGAARGGIGGTGITAIGVIQRFGSIYVNGAEYLLSPKTRYWVDGRRANVDALHRGQNVFVDAFPQGGRPTARNVRVQHALIGIVQAVADDGRQIRILGQTIHVSARALARLEHIHPARGMELAVSADSPASGRWVATRIRALPKRHDGPARFLIRGTLHMAGRHRLTLGNRSFLWVGPQAPRNLVGRYVVAQGYYRFGHPAVNSLRPATGLADAQTRISIAGYIRLVHGAWRFDGQTLIAPVRRAPSAARRPMFLTVRREGADRFVVIRTSPNIHIMSFGLHLAGKAAKGPTRPRLTRPALTRPQIIRPMVTRPQTVPPPPSPSFPSLPPDR